MPRVPRAAYGRAMRTFLVESYVPNLDSATAAELSSRLRSAVTDLQREGLTLQWLRSFALVEDETYVWMVDAPDADHVALVYGRAAVSVDHVAAVSGGRE
jgi:hypothetical protein